MLNFFAQHSLVEGDYNLKDIKVMDEIGRGNSHVYTAWINNCCYAMKQIEIKTDYEYQYFLKQIMHMKQLSQISKDLIKYYGYFVTMQEINQYCRRRYAHIIMQCAQMNLQNLMSCRMGEGKRFNKYQIINIIDFLVNAYSHLQKNKIAHCDIKPQNILILSSKQLTMKICDVGSSKIIDSQSVQQETVLGTVPFLAPELVKTKSNKIISSNVFKSDVFSFGLVILYIITFKKFTSKERIQIPEHVYFQVITQWIKQARQIVNYDNQIAEVLRRSLQFQQYKRPLFKQVKALYELEKKRKQSAIEANYKKLINQDSEKQIQEGYTSLVPTSTKKTSPFKNRNLTTKISTRTTSIGFPKINRNFQKQVSPPAFTSPISPLLKRQSMCFANTSNSPEKFNNSIIDFKKIIYVTEQDKQTIPFEYLMQQQKIYVLFTPCLQIKKAETVSIYQTCLLSSFYDLAESEVNKLYLQYEGFQGVGVDSNYPTLRIKKIYANLRQTELIGGYKYLFRSFCSNQLEYLQIDLTGSYLVLTDLIDLLDRLSGKSMKYLGIIWQGYLMSPDEHSQIIQKVSKISVKKLTLIMNQNFIKYEKQARWPLPKNCQVLYLEYTSNFMQKMISNLSISISKCPIKQLYLNFSNNNLNKSQANMLFKSVASIQTLQKLIFNLSWNPLQDISYIISSLRDLREVSSLQLKLYHTGISENQIFQALQQIKQSFEMNLKILKIAFDRHSRKQQYKHKIEKVLNNNKMLKIDVIGYDNKYLMAFIKKTSKGAKSKNNTTLNRLKGQKNSLLGFKTVVQQKEPKKIGGCLSLYSNNRNFDNYICLACSDLNQICKTQYFCKYCIENCKHKGHNIVKIYERVRCCCSYSGSCTCEIAKRICAQTLKIRYKKVYKCFKCNKIFCQGCISRCTDFHKLWVQQTKMNIIFQCGSPI